MSYEVAAPSDGGGIAQEADAARPPVKRDLGSLAFEPMTPAPPAPSNPGIGEPRSPEKEAALPPDGVATEQEVEEMKRALGITSLSQLEPMTPAAASEATLPSVAPIAGPPRPVAAVGLDASDASSSSSARGVSTRTAGPGAPSVDEGGTDGPQGSAPALVAPSTSTAAGGEQASVSPRTQRRPPGADVYHIRSIQWGGTPSAVICQNTNGPCPLLALCNVLLLRGKIHLHPESSQVSFQHLLQLLTTALLDSTAHRELAPEQLAAWEHNLQACIELFPRLEQGLDINVRFTGVDAFEFTRELSVFDIFNVE